MCFSFVHTGGIYILKNKLVALDPELLFADGYDDCIIGMTFRADVPVVIYSADKIIDKLANEMSYEEAQEFFDFNIEGAYVGERTPMYWYDARRDAE
jgi:hypothetical protein